MKKILFLLAASLLLGTSDGTGAIVLRVWKVL